MKKIFILILITIIYLVPLQIEARLDLKTESFPSELLLLKTIPRYYPLAVYKENYLLYYYDMDLHQGDVGLGLNMLDCRDLVPLWEKSYEFKAPFNCCADGSASMKLYKDYVFVLVKSKAQNIDFDSIVCLNAVDGKTIWNQKISFMTDMYYQIADDKIFIYGNDGNMLCIDVNNGNILWQDDLKSFHCSYSDKISTIDGERFIFLTQNLWAYSHTSKKVLWGATLNDGCYVDWYGGYLHMLCSGQPIFVDKKVWLLVPDRTNDPSKDCCFSFQMRDFDSGEIIFK